jgi:DNA polymerase I-like protein with 3'-5' exonuclease and polymerase domains
MEMLSEEHVPLRAGIVYDDQKKTVGTYIYLGEEDQELFDSLCDSWLRTYQSDSKFYLTLDLETTGLNPLFPNMEILLHSISWNGKQAIIFEHHKMNLDRYKEVLNTIPLNNHNIKFDLKWLRAKMGVNPIIFWDTMVTCQMGWAGAFPGQRFGLDNVIKQLLVDFKISKDTRKEFIGKRPLSGFTRDQIEYAVKDSLFTHRLVPLIRQRLINQNLMDIWLECEQPLLQEMVEIELEGVDVDKAGIEKMYDEKELHRLELDDQIQEYLNNLPEDVRPKKPKGKKRYNANSIKQVPSMLDAVGIKIPNCKEDTLLTAMAQHKHPLVNLIVDYRSTQTEISKQLKKWKDVFINPLTNKIYPTYSTHGAETGRFSASEPPIHQTTKKLRPMIIAPPGWKISTRDMSQYEMRAAAGIANEPYLLDIYRDRANLLPVIQKIALRYGERDADGFTKTALAGGVPGLLPEELELCKQFSFTDAHKRNAALVFGVDVSQVTGEQREIAKCVSVDSLLHTEWGVVPVGSLLPKRPKAGTYYPLKGVRVVTDRGLAEADQVYYMGRTKAYRVRLVSGEQLVCSGVHQWRTLNKKHQYDWIKTSKLKVDDCVFLKMGELFKPREGTRTKLNKASAGPLLSMALSGQLRAEGDTIQFMSAASLIVKDSILLPYEGKWRDVQTRRKPGQKNGVNIEDVPAGTPLLAVRCPEAAEDVRKVSRYDALMQVAGEGSGWRPIASLLFSLSVEEGNNRHWVCDSYREAQLVRNLLQRFAVPSNVRGPHQNAIGKWTVKSTLRPKEIAVALTEGQHLYERTWRNTKRMVGKRGHELMLAYEWSGTTDSKALREKYPDEFQEELEQCMGSYWPTASMLMENNLLYDRVASIEELGEVEMCDVSVPEGHTVVYNGIVTHNTLGYAILYGSGPATMQQQLAKKNFLYDIDFLSGIQETFFRKLPNITTFIGEVHKSVRDGGYVQSPCGRRRYFSLPPKYMTRKYQMEKEGAQREAVNYFFQNSNAHATKMSMVELTRIFRERYETPPVIIINMHDELAIKALDKDIDEVYELQGKIMEEWGALSINNTCPV